MSWDRIIWFGEYVLLFANDKTLMWTNWLYWIQYFVALCPYIFWFTCVGLHVLYLVSDQIWFRSEQNSWTLKLSTSTNPSIRSFLTAYSVLGCRGNWVIRATHASFSPATLFSSSWEIPNAPSPPGTCSPRVWPRCPPVSCVLHFPGRRGMQVRNVHTSQISTMCRMVWVLNKLTGPAPICRWVCNIKEKNT